MRLSRNDESGIKPIVRHSSNYVAGAAIPIKKRRFPIILSHSPPPKESSIVPARDVFSQNEHPCLSQGSTPTSVSVATGSTLSDTNKGFVSDEKKGSSDVNMGPSYGSNYSRVKLKEPSLTFHSGSFDFMGAKEKLPIGGKFAKCEITSGRTELQLAPIIDFALIARKEINGNQKVEGKCKLEVSAIAGDTELSLGLEDHHLVPAKAGQSSNRSGQDHKNVEPTASNSSLSKGKGFSENTNDEVPSSLGTAHIHAKRSNWDLNTLMDTWEGINDITFSGCSAASEMQFHVDCEQRSNLTTSCRPSVQSYNSGDFLNLRLSPSCFRSDFSKEPSDLSTNVTDPNLHRLGTSVNCNVVNYMTAKSKPFDGSAGQELKEAKSDFLGLADSRAVNSELVERCSLEATKSSNDAKSTKSEPFPPGSQETLQKMDGVPKQSGDCQQCLDNCSCSVSVTRHLLLPSGKPTCLVELNISGNVLNHLQQPTNTKGDHLDGGELPLEACDNFGQVASANVGQNGKESSTSVVIDDALAEIENSDDRGKCRLKFVHEAHRDSRGNGETSISEGKNFNISGDILEDSYGSDYESDGNYTLGMTMDVEQYGVEDDDFEDGEVRELLAYTRTEGPISREREIEHFSHGDADDRKLNTPEVSCHECITSSPVEEEDSKTHDPDDPYKDGIKYCVDTVNEDKGNKATEKDSFLQESSAIETPTNSTDKNILGTITQRKPITVLKSIDASKRQETGQPSHQSTSRIQGTSLIVTQGADENVKKTDVTGNNELASPTEEASLNCIDAAKDVNCGRANQSRIINLSRASNFLSPSELKSFSQKLLPSRSKRESLSDVALEGDKLHPRRRYETVADGSHKFSRHRHHDQSARSSGLNFLRGRGRVSSRSDTLRGDWNSEHDFARECYDFCVPRHKYSSAVSDADLYYSNYNMAQDDAIVGAGERGKKRPNGKGEIFSHIPSRRWAPRVRGGSAGQGQMIHRSRRKISLNRCIGEDDTELIGMRHGEKNFMRQFPDDDMDTMFMHSRRPYEEVDFVREDRNFSSLQGRSHPQMHSKSPIRSRSRSPGPSSNPRRRSPDVSGEYPKLPHQRSSAVYSMERMSSPGRLRERVVRRHDSPPFLSCQSTELRDMDSGQDNTHLKRSHNRHVLIRKSKRLDITNPRETDGDEYYRGPEHSGRFHKLEGNGNGEERRFSDRSEPVRSLRNHYNDAEGKKEGRRPYRLSQEDNSDMIQDSMQIRNQQGNVTRRMRSIEEQEVNFRHGEQVWHDDKFIDRP